MILYKPFILNDHFLGRRVIKPVRLLMMAISIFILKSLSFKFLLWNSDGNTGFSSNVTTILSLGRQNFLNWKPVTPIGTKKKSYNGLSQNPTMTRLNGFCGKVYSALSGGATEAWREKEREPYFKTGSPPQPQPPPMSRAPAESQRPSYTLTANN